MDGQEEECPDALAPVYLRSDEKGIWTGGKEVETNGGSPQNRRLGNAHWRRR